MTSNNLSAKFWRSHLDFPRRVYQFVLLRMSQRGRSSSQSKQRIVIHDSSSEDEYTPSALQPSQLSQRSVNLSPEEQERLVNDIVHYLLIIDQKKTPIKRPEINKHILKDNSRLFNVLLPPVKKKLNQVFGLDLEEIPTKKGHYILTNRIKIRESEDHLKESGKEAPKFSLLTIILSLIFMSGNSIKEKVLWRTLKKLGIDPDSNRPHEVFGDVKKLLTQDFVKQMYLEVSKVPGVDPIELEFRWGFRATKEVSKRSVLNFVSFIYGGIPIEQWATQYQEVVAEEMGSEQNNENH